MHKETEFRRSECGNSAQSAERGDSVRSIGEVLAEWFDLHPGLRVEQPLLVRHEVAPA